ncbi:hypothetical protein HL653_10640 [Sphingomonas sp. AP4-R1]|uniref:hypothetical protein n=1 Tax=Sphingomonas sp. AP4-R1 TaxID=2735134 RepID=UPI001493C228|nr:hypothetical protein [Sphingomonas sp. AP4-R1]QJU58193.1 hypothetical protein HL653_10640 [Sphingomonas sp. AP4-R1]
MTLTVATACARARTATVAVVGSKADPRAFDPGRPALGIVEMRAVQSASHSTSMKERERRKAGARQE